MAAAEPLYEGIREGGVLMTDGYEPYNAIAKAHKLVHLGCRTHCRRGFANGIDGYRYLRELLVALPRAKTVDDYEALLPRRLTHKRA